jgi:Periplasmic binding protein domain
MIVRPFLGYLTRNVLKTGTHTRVYFLGGDYVYPRATNQYARQIAEELGLTVVGDE